MNSTEIINYAVDIQINQQMKFILLLIFVAVAGFGWYYAKTKEPDMLWEWQLNKIISPISKIFIFLSPVWVLLLSRNVPVDSFLKFMLIIYGGVLVLAGFLFFVFGAEWLKNFFTGEGFYRKGFGEVKLR